MFKIATLLQACLGLHHPEIYPILVLMHSRFKKGVLPIIRLPAEAIKFAPAYFFCRRKYKWTSKMIWRSFDNLKKPPRLLYAFSFDGYSASTTAFSIQEHLTIRNWQCQYIIKINRITVYPFIYKRVNRYKREVGLGLFYSLFSFLLLFSSLTFPE